MCGIAGIWGSGEIRKMVRVLEHRGPDSVGFFEKDQVHLGIRRLSILDLEGGGQPIRNEDSSLVIIHNGEVYNYEDLREVLIKKGYNFKTKTDTEVILYSYQEWGESCLAHFNGMFAFAIWDDRKKRLFLARDRVGVKPLYWSFVNNRFLFASEIKSILQEYSSEPELDSAFFSFECPVFEKTLFKNIQAVLPGHYLTFDGRKVETKQYWKIPENPTEEKVSENEAVEELSWLLRDSVRLRMKSDVPVGLFASGGMDSAIIASLSGVRFLYSCRYPFGNAYDEFRYVELLGRDLGVSPIVVTPTAEDFQEAIQSIIYYLDHPIATASSISEFMLAKRASQDVTVVLGGQGADEIFGGYVRYLVMLQQDYSRKEFDAYQDLIRYFQNQPDGFCLQDKYFHLSNRGAGNENLDLFRPYFSNSRNPVDQMGLCDMVFVLPSLLTMNDRAGAHIGLENRTPFLDYRIVEFAFKIPNSLKIRDGISKYILREASKGLIPEEIRTRSDKKGLTTPVNIWLNGPLKEWATSVSDRLDQRGMKWPQSGPSRGEFDRYLYSRLCLELWFENFFPDFKFEEFSA